MTHFARGGQQMKLVWICTTVLALACIFNASAEPPGDGWFKVWSDEFNSREIDESEWRLITNEDWNKDGKLSWFDAKNVKLDGQHLVIENHWHKSGGSHGEDYSGGRADTHKRWTYGYFEARIRFEDDDNHFWPTFWMWKWLPEGIATEFDIMEFSAWHDTPTQSHHTKGKDNRITEESGEDIDDWHIWAVLWTEDEVSFFIDGDKQYSSPYAESARGEELPIIFTCTPNREKNPRMSGEYPRLLVDWVRVWQPIMDSPEGMATLIPTDEKIVAWSKASGRMLIVSPGKGQLEDLLMAPQLKKEMPSSPFTVVGLDDGHVALKTTDGLYVSVDHDRKDRVYGTANEPGEWERFEWMPQSDGTMALRCVANQRYLTVNKKTYFSLSATATNVGPNEKFRFETL